MELTETPEQLFPQAQASSTKACIEEERRALRLLLPSMPRAMGKASRASEGVLVRPSKASSTIRANPYFRLSGSRRGGIPTRLAGAVG